MRRTCVQARCDPSSEVPLPSSEKANESLELDVQLGPSPVTALSVVLQLIDRSQHHTIAWGVGDKLGFWYPS